MRTLRLPTFLRPGAHFYLERQRPAAGGMPQEGGRHRHTFCEFYWVEQGYGHELRDDGLHAVEAGSLVLLRPEDAHALACTSGEGLLIWNCAFPQADWRGLVRRHRGELRDWFALPAAERRLRLDATRLSILGGWAREVVEGGRRRIDLDRLLLELARLLDGLPTPGDETPPDWLLSAVEAVREPRWFALGPAALVRLSGRSAEHVARSVRKHFGQTPTQLVNQARLAWAGERLAGSDEAIVDIALACGWQNLGCFYRSFGKRYGMPPKAWRDRARRMLQ